tara:strand:+ start:8827 stop:8985 length:159 start_codon:yes stop_codon:yes gene_type:complete
VISYEYGIKDDYSKILVYITTLGEEFFQALGVYTSARDQPSKTPAPVLAQGL